MKLLVKLALILFLIGLITSCSSSRKCGNKKGIKTPMGVM
jgi:hypothetical protein